MSDNFEKNIYRSLGRVEAKLTAISESIAELKVTSHSTQCRLLKLERQHSLWRGAVTIMAPACAFAGAVLEKIFTSLMFWR